MISGLNIPTLTESECREIDARPISSAWVDFTEEQLQTRIEIGKKIWDYFMECDDTMTPAHKAAYGTCPPWKFYMSNDMTGFPKRVYGAILMKRKADRDGEPDKTVHGVHVVSAHIGMNNDVVGGMYIEDLVAVDRWSDSSKSFLKEWGKAPGIFLDPLGFLYIIFNHYEWEDLLSVS